MEMKSRLLAAAAVVGLVVTACSGGNATPSPTTAPTPVASAASMAPESMAPASPSAAAADPKTATSAADLGGMDALVAAAKAEGTLNVIALPPDWANYGQIIDAFKAKYGINIVSDQPDGSSADEINAAKNNQGTDAAPDVFDLGVNVALSNTDMFAPYKVSNWSDIPDNLKEASGLWFSDYAGYESVGCDTAKAPAPAKMSDLLDPKYKGMVALNGDPTQAAAGFYGVVMASLANGGSADDISKGVDFFKQLNTAGNLLPVDPNPATIKSGQTPCVIDWLYNNRAQTDALKGTIDFQVTIPSDAPPVAAYYIQAINKNAPHPAAARLWEEYLYSPDGSNGWLKGYAVPATIAAMQANNTVDAAALAALPPTTQTPVVLTQDQITKGQDYLKANWNFITIK
jgi:putative spermidine/putrescine transport system substrate-binding protein